MKVLIFKIKILVQQKLTNDWFPFGDYYLFVVVQFVLPKLFLFKLKGLNLLVITLH